MRNKDTHTHTFVRPLRLSHGVGIVVMCDKDRTKNTKRKLKGVTAYITHTDWLSKLLIDHQNKWTWRQFTIFFFQRKQKQSMCARIFLSTSTYVNYFFFSRFKLAFRLRCVDAGVLCIFLVFGRHGVRERNKQKSSCENVLTIVDNCETILVRRWCPFRCFRILRFAIAICLR